MPVLPALTLALTLAGAMATSCARAPAVQPVGRVANGNQVRTLSAKEVGPVDDFLDRHPAELGILATPAPAVGASANPPAARQSSPTGHIPLTGPRRAE